MPRPQRPLDPLAGPVQAFAAELRLVREKAGNPKFLQMARASGRSRTALAEAAGGDHLATWETVEAFLTACGQDPRHWYGRWEAVRTATAAKEPGRTPAPPDLAVESRQQPGPPPVPPRPPRWRRPLVAALAVVAAAGLLVAFLDSPDNGGREPGRGASPSPLPAGPVTVVVQNKVAVGASGLFEDSTPVYLSTRPVPFCSREGCEVADTRMWSGAVLQVLCQEQGAVMTNEDAATAGITHNPGAVTSALWYQAEMPNGTDGFISEVYLTPASRGGRGLPACAPP